MRTATGRPYGFYFRYRSCRKSLFFTVGASSARPCGSRYGFTLGCGEFVGLYCAYLLFLLKGFVFIFFRNSPFCHPERSTQCVVEGSTAFVICTAANRYEDPSARLRLAQDDRFIHIKQKSLRKNSSGTNLQIRGTTLIISKEIPSRSNKRYPLTREHGSHY